METKTCLHDGHRERLIKKFVDNPDGFLDHELLEILLFQFIPRKNTNDIAHRLLQTFGSLNKIFTASVKELTTVNGIGEKTAISITMLGKVFKRLNFSNEVPFFEAFSFATAQKDFIKLFHGVWKEQTFIILFDKKNKYITHVSFDSNSSTETSVDKSLLVNAIALNKPSFIIMVHNHPSGNPEPSFNDDKATAIINDICDLMGVAFHDHVIVAGDKTFSYFHTHRLEEAITAYGKNITRKL